MRDRSQHAALVTSVHVRARASHRIFILFIRKLQPSNNLLAPNYEGNLMAFIPVPTMALIWVTKLFSFAPMKKPLAL
jgi:hypothetical protein